VLTANTMTSAANFPARSSKMHASEGVRDRDSR
jgi:hypothetical protein